MRILLIEPGLAPRSTEIESTLEAMQTTVGGLIQVIYPFPDRVALICNDEGKLLGLPLNRALRHPETNEIYDVVAGTFFLCAAPEDNDNFDSLSDEQIAQYSELFRYPELFLKGGEPV